MVVEAYSEVNDAKFYFPIETTSNYCEEVIQLTPEISCDIDSIVWSDGSELPYYDVFLNTSCDTITVNLKCRDGCEYDAFFCASV